jgi:hypothetical protein
MNDTWKKWYDRIDAFPSAKGLVLLGMFGFAATGTFIAGASVFFAWSNKEPTQMYIDVLDKWMDKVLIVMGIATGHFIGKRATTKPELETPDAAANAQ